MKRYEALEDLLGRLISYAGLVYAGNTTDPVRAKFYGDMQETHHRGLAASACSSRSSSTASTTPRSTPRWRDPALGHYRPWIEDVRKEKPYQLEDRIEQLFHEKSVTGAGAWNRLFDETIAALRFKVDGKELALEPTLNLLQDTDEREAQGRGRGARARPSRRTCAPSR